MKTMLPIMSLLVLFSLSGCAPAWIHVNGFLDPDLSIPPGSSIHVVQNEKIGNPIFEKEVRQKINRLLQRKGYRPCSVQEADFYLLPAYGAGSPQTITAMAQTFRIPYSYSSFTVPYQTTTVSHCLLLAVYDANIYRKTGKMTTVWFREILTTAQDSDLRKTINFMLVAAFEHFGQNTGKVVQEGFLMGDERLKALEK